MGVAQRVVAAPWVAGLAARSGAMSDAFDVAEWLGGEIEDPRTKAPHVLPEKLIVILQDGFRDEVFTEDDVTALDTSKFDKMAEEKWIAIHKDSAACKPAHREMATHRLALLRWLNLSYPSLDGTSSNDGSELAVSEKERGDLREQGLPDTRALRMLELSLTLLRATGKHELAGGTYEGEPLSYLVAKDAAKRGDTTIMKVLAECRKLGSPYPLVRAHDNLILEWNTKGPAYIASRIMIVVMTARKHLGVTMAYVYYFEEVTRRYRGRGLPVVLDYELLHLAEKEAAADKPTLSSLCGGGGSTAGGSSASSALGSSVSSQGSGMVDMLAQLKLMSEHSEEQLKISRRQEQKIGDLSKELASLKSNNRGGVCYKCGEPGHRQDQCTKDKEK